jgi:DNA-binding response OmpR family regulator
MSRPDAVVEHDMRLLLAEDDRKVSDFVARGLRAERFAVDLAFDGQSACEFATSFQYDAIILDLMLPVLNGTEVLKRIRRQHPEVPVLILTAKDDTAAKVENFEAGADDYLTKPFDLGELLARCRALTRRGAAPLAEGPLVHGPLLVDRGERKVLLEGRKIDLTPREFSLLVHLIREAGRVVTRMDILGKVWEIPFDPGSNVIEVHIKNIRDKLGEQAKMIETVRGMGYRLVALK